jgi:putative acetyltransferase
LFTTVRTNSSDIRFQELVIALDKDLAIRDGEDHAFFAQFNGIATINHAVIILQDNIAIGCGAFKLYQDAIVEIKRMYVLPEKRKLGAASLILQELENWAKELGYHTCILETGFKQPEAIQLYQKNNYIVIPNYGVYENVESSVCFEKKLLDLPQ